MLERQIQESNQHHREEVDVLEGRMEEVQGLLEEQKSKCKKQEEEIDLLQAKVGLGLYRNLS